MKNSIKFISRGNNKYIYSNKNILYLSHKLEESMHYDKGQDYNDYYSRKLEFWKKQGVFDQDTHEFEVNIEGESIKRNLGNLKQFLIEVTDDCNLACKYCGYRELYINYDSRVGKKQSLQKIKLFIDYLSSIWESSYNISHNNIITIGFYGGEPLLEIDLIKQTIEYIEKYDFKNVTFNYGMTSNAVLLDKCVDFLVAKQVNLLISLDGNKYHHSYRITKNGKSSYDLIVKNIQTLRKKYPEYYEKYVNFNAVLHNRNSFKVVHEFILETFGKAPRVAELATNGIADEKKEEFSQMYQSKLESSKGQFLINEELDSKDLFDNPEVLLFSDFIDSTTGNTFNFLEELFSTTTKTAYLPTGTCQPFERKVFLTVNGKILPCEKIGQEYTIGNIDNEDIHIDFEQISHIYANRYTKVLNQCKKCFTWKSCGQCIFLLKEINNKLQCPSFMAKNNATRYLSDGMSITESYPYLQEKLIEELIIE